MDNTMQILITGDARGFKAAADSVVRDLLGLEKTGSLMGAGMRAAFLPITAALAGISFVALTKEAIDNADAMDELSQRAGITVEKFSGLNYAAKMSGLSTEDLSGVVRHLNNSLVESQDASPKSASLFKALGMQTRDASGHLRGADEVLLDVADRFQQMPDGAMKSATAMELFGKSGADVVTMLNNGSAGINALTDEAKSLGQVISTDTAKKAGDFNDSLDRLKATMTGIVNGVLPPLVSGLNALADAFGLGPKEIGDRAAQMSEDLVKLNTLYKSQFMAVEAAQKAASAGNDAAKKALDGYKQAADETLKKIKAVEQAINRVNNPVDSTAALQKRAQTGSAKPKEDKSDVAEYAAQYADSFKRIQSIISEANPNDSAAKKWLEDYKLLAQYLSGDELTSAIEDLNELFGKSKDSAEEWANNEATRALQSLADEGHQLTESVRTDVEVLNDSIEKYVGMLATGAISQETFNRLVEKAGADFNGTAKAADEVAQIYKDTATSIRGAFRDTFRSVFDEGLDGFKGLGDRILNIFKDMLADMATMAIARPIIIPMMSAVGGMMGVSGDAQASVAQQLGGGNLAGFTPGSAIAQAAFSSMGTFGGGMAATLPGLLGGAGGGFSAASSMASMGAPLGATLGAYAGAALPWVAGALVLDKITGGGVFGTKWKTTDAGLNLNVSDGDVSGTRYKMASRKKSLLRGTSNSYEESALDGELLHQLNTSLDNSKQMLITGAEGLGAAAADSIIEGFKKSSRISLQGKSQEETQKAIDDWMGQTVADMGVAILQNGPLRGLFASVQKNITSMWTDEGAKQIISFKLIYSASEAMIKSLFALGNYMAADPLKDFTEMQRLSSRTLTEQLSDQAKALLTLVGAYDGSEQATKDLAAATQDRYKMELQLLQQISDVRSGVHDLIGGSVESIKQSAMSPDQLYSYLTNKAETLANGLSSVTDPTQINKMVEQINALSNQAYGMLPKGVNSQEFIDFLSGVESTANKQLATAEGQLKATHQDISDAIRTTMEQVAQRQQEAAQAQLEAAQAAQKAAEDLQRAAEELRRNRNNSYG